MSAKKELTTGAYNTSSREDQIQQALEDTPDMDREEIESLAIKLNVATAKGKHVPTTVESVALKVLSQKFIKDAPKEIHLQAEVKTEQVIMNWLQQNGELASLAEQRAISQSPIQDAHYEVLEGFATEIRGEVIISDGDEDAV
jgi:hypothetical protein